MRTVELVTVAATLVATIATLVNLRRRKPASPFGKWRARRAAASTDPRPE